MSQSITFCYQCAHLLGKRTAIESVERWRCYHPSNISSKRFNLVTGEPITILVCDSIADARGSEDVCPYFELYNPPAPPPTSTYQNPPPASQYNPSASSSSSLARLKTKMKNLSVDDL